MWLPLNQFGKLGYQAKLGDIIKFGRIRFRISQIKIFEEYKEETAKKINNKIVPEKIIQNQNINKQIV